MTRGFWILQDDVMKFETFRNWWLPGDRQTKSLLHHFKNYKVIISFTLEQHFDFWWICVDLLHRLKFIYSEKATQFCEIFTLLLTGTTQDKSKVKISKNFVAFSKYSRVLILSWEKEYLQANRLLIQFLIRCSYNITKSCIHTKTAN